MPEKLEISPGFLLASALAGSVARIPTHPIDTIKARMMASSSSSSFSQTLSSTYNLEGWRGLYRGFWFTATASLPASCVYFTTQEWSRTHVFSNALLSGFLAEAVSCVLYVPIDVVKERVQVQRIDTATKEYGLRYANGLTAFKAIIAEEGLSGLYKGYFSTLASFGPFSALYFYFYEGYREQITGIYDNKPIPAYAFWMGGGLCGAAAAFLTTPLDLIKLRKQLDPMSPFYHKGDLSSGLARTLKAEGFAGVFRGASARVLFFSPTTAFSMALFEVLKARIS